MYLSHTATQLFFISIVRTNEEKKTVKREEYSRVLYSNYIYFIRMVSFFCNQLPIDHILLRESLSKRLEFYNLDLFLKSGDK